MRSPLAGNWLSQQARLLLASSQPAVSLTPHYLVSSKNAVDAGAPASATYRSFATPPHPSFRRLQEDRVLREFKESVVQVWPGPGKLSSGGPGMGPEDVVRTQPGRPFEMPDGWNQVYGPERLRVVEGMFDAKMAYTDADNPAPPPSQTLPALIQASVAAMDVDIRPHLLNNVVVTGGTSILQGFTDRLNHELAAMYPGPRLRITAPGNTAERRFASWIGGSILGSLGTFHQVRPSPPPRSPLTGHVTDVDLEERIRRTRRVDHRQAMQMRHRRRGGSGPVGEQEGDGDAPDVSYTTCPLPGSPADDGRVILRSAASLAASVHHGYDEPRNVNHGHNVQDAS